MFIHIYIYYKIYERKNTKASRQIEVIIIKNCVCNCLYKNQHNLLERILNKRAKYLPSARVGSGQIYGRNQCPDSTATAADRRLLEGSLNLRMPSILTKMFILN